MQNPEYFPGFVFTARQATLEQLACSYRPGCTGSTKHKIARYKISNLDLNLTFAFHTNSY